jgi:hypothetical protein
MAIYFIGRKKVGSFILCPYKNGLLKCDAFERWEDIDLSSTARCGVAGSIEVIKEVGLSERDYHTLTVSVGGSIGVEGIASLKSKVEETVGREVNWNVARTTKQTFSFTSDKCGSHNETVYQMIREYELSYRRRKLFGYFGLESWERTLRERTQCYDALPEIEDWDEACNCPEPNRRDYDGRLRVDLGDLGMRVPFRRVPGGIEINFGRKLGIVRHALTGEFHGRVPADLLPDALRFLGDVAGDYMECTFSPYADPDPVGCQVPIRDFPDLHSRLDTFTVEQDCGLKEGES